MENDSQMNTYHQTPLFWVALFMIVLVAKGIRADEVTCPVCLQPFSDETDVCPNDGTNIKLLGVPVEKKDETSDKTEQKEDGKDKPEEGAEDGETEEEGAGYRRHDRGDGRRRTKQSGSGTYSDRRSRISDGRLGSSTNLGKKRRQEEEKKLRLFLEEDKRLLDDFDSRREQSWKERQQFRLAEFKAQEDRAKAQARLLDGLGAPLTSLGFRMFWMGEGRSEGIVSAAEIDLNLARYRLRAGVSTLIGIRSLSSRNDLIFLEHVFIGFQWPKRFSPYFVLRGGVGVLVSERFGVDLIYLVTSVGAEVGIDSWVTPWIAVTPSIGYERYMLNDAYWNSATVKISVGF